MNESIEILAPAGGEEALKAAAFAGTDAVYLGGKSFGARANASNFSNEELTAAIEFCHERGVRVYVTVNTLLKDSELHEALKFAEFLCSVHADGIIIQDFGLFSILRECAPDMSLYASTQMSVHNLSGARFVQNAGAKRVVLARELSLREIEEISDNSEIELEVFVHGALCMSVSGQCYFSAMLGSRSGNRGMCAQPCRLPFSSANTENALSLKDLSAIGEIDKLKQAGVASLKIEGRMKRPEYVAAAVAAARKAADGEEIPAELLADLEAVFSRSGFTNGYLEGKLGGAMFGVRTREDVVSADNNVMKKLQTLYHKERQAIPVDFILAQKEDIKMTAASGDVIVSVSNDKNESVGKLTAERSLEQLRKTGGTPFFTRNVTVPQEGADITIAELNALRRSALKALLEARAKREPIPFDMKLAESRLSEMKVKSKARGEPLPLHISFRKVAQIKSGDMLEKAEKIYLPLFEKLDDIRNLGIEKEKTVFEIPRAVFGIDEENRIKQRISELKEEGYKAFACYNIGAVEICKELETEIIGGYSLNITNSAALEFFTENGVSSAELSMELALKEAERISGEIPCGAMIYGHHALMLTRNCSSSHGGCKDCRGESLITDRKNISFPVVCNGAGRARYSEVLNSIPVYMGDRLHELGNIDYGIARFTVESADECEEIIEKIRNGEEYARPYTRGLLYRGIN